MPSDTHPSFRPRRKAGSLRKAWPHLEGPSSCLVPSSGLPGARPARATLCGRYPVAERGWSTRASPGPGWPGDRGQRPLRCPLPWRSALLSFRCPPLPPGPFPEPAGMFWLMGSCEDSVTISGTPEGDKLRLFLTRGPHARQARGPWAADHPTGARCVWALSPAGKFLGRGPAPPLWEFRGWVLGQPQPCHILLGGGSGLATS